MAKRTRPGEGPVVRTLLILLTLAGILGLGTVALGGPGQDTVPTMRGVLSALLKLLPLSLEPARFQAPENRQQITEALQVLARNAAIVREHGLGLDPSYDQARSSLGHDAQDALSAFETGDKQSARFVVRNLTNDCFDCHTRLPAEDATAVAPQLGVALDLTRIPIGERLDLLVATRQFGSALDLAEQLLQDTDHDPAQLDLMGTFEDYLAVSIRVRHDLSRPRAALARFLSRDDLPLYLQTQVMEWIMAIDELAPAMSTRDRLQTARQLLEEARRRNLYLRDRRGLIHAVVASGLLHEAVAQESHSSEELSEIYYLLGVAETSISRSTWVPETEFFLERSIRAAPSSSYARQAYDFLEQYIIASYTGSAGLDVPKGVWSRLMELRALVQEQR